MVISGCPDVFNLVHISEGGDHFIDKFCSTVGGHDGRDSMAANDIFVEEVSD